MSISEIMQKVEEVQDKLEKIGFPKLSVNVEVGKLGRGIAGSAFYKTKLIVISSDYLKEYPERIIDITVPHEIAHLYTIEYYPRAKQAHGPEWRRICRYLGINGDTYHKMKLENGPTIKRREKVRFIYVTEVTKKEIKLTKGQHEKVQGGGKFSCDGEPIKYINKKIIIK